MKTTRELLIERMGNDINIFSPKGVDIMVEIIEEIAEQKVKTCNKPQVSGCDGLIEEKIFKLKFPNEEFNINDYNDWVSENGREAYQLCLKVIKSSHCR